MRVSFVSDPVSQSVSHIGSRADLSLRSTPNRITLQRRKHRRRHCDWTRGRGRRTRGRKIGMEISFANKRRVSSIIIISSKSITDQRHDWYIPGLWAFVLSWDAVFSFLWEGGGEGEGMRSPHRWILFNKRRWRPKERGKEGKGKTRRESILQISYQMPLDWIRYCLAFPSFISRPCLPVVLCHQQSPRASPIQIRSSQVSIYHGFHYFIQKNTKCGNISAQKLSKFDCALPVSFSSPEEPEHRHPLRTSCRIPRPKLYILWNNY